MSGFFVDYEDTTVIPFDDGVLAGTSVRVRTELSGVEISRLTTSGIGAEIGEDGTVKPVLAEGMIADSDLRKLIAWVRGWTFPKSATAKSAPEWRPGVSDFEKLRPAHQAQLLAAITRHEEQVALESVPVESPLPEASGSQTPDAPVTNDGTTREPASLKSASTSPEPSTITTPA